MKHRELTDELQEKAILYAAGALDEREREEYARHLQEDNCAICKAEVLESEAAAQSLTIMLPMQTPSESVKRRLLGRAEAASFPARGTVPVLRPRPVVAWGGWVAAVAALILAAVFLYTNAGLRDEVRSLNARVAELESQVNETQVRLAFYTSADKIIKLAGQGATPQAQGRVYWKEAARRWRVTIDNLPELSNDRVYQLWFVPQGANPISAEVFTTNASGSVEFEIDVPPAVTSLMAAAVTVEPAPQGSPQPTSGFALLGTP